MAVCFVDWQFGTHLKEINFSQTPVHRYSGWYNENDMRHRILVGIFILILLSGSLPWLSFQNDHKQTNHSTGVLPNPVPTPTIDRLALPVLSENPTQIELGNSLYYYHCMPCHGDRGQGLTDEWREVWEEDHQDCWARGCHGVRNKEGVFRIPTTVPPVTGSANILGQYSNPDTLIKYLRKTHPPQSPGILKDDEYWALTAYLLSQNGLISPSDEVGPRAKTHFWRRVILITGCIIGSASVLLLMAMKRKSVR